MPSKSVRHVIQEFSFDRKLLFAGAVLLALGAFLPWYQDRDSFNTGDMYLGITGPLSLLGLTLLGASALVITLLFMEASGKKLSFLPVKNSSVYLFCGLVSFYLLLLGTSIYFHQKFGLNITMKQPQFGMFFSFIAAAFMTIGGYLTGRDRATLLKEFQQDTAPTVAAVAPAPVRQPTAHQAPSFSQHSQQQKPRENLVRTVHVPRVDVPVREPVSQVHEPVSDSQAKTPQAFRTDL